MSCSSTSNRKIQFLFLTVLIFAISDASAAKDCTYATLTKAAYKTTDLLVQAVQDDCPTLLADTLKNEKSEELYSSTKEFTEKSVAHIALTAEMIGTPADKDDMALLSKKIDVYTKFGEFLSSRCTAKEEKACVAEVTFQESARKLKAKLDEIDKEDEENEKIAAHNQTPEGIIEKVCACDKFINLNQKTIDRQKEIRKISGTVNPVTLNSAGAQIVDLKRMRGDLAKNYKQKTKKELKNYKCKNVDDLTNPLLDGTGIRGI